MAQLIDLIVILALAMNFVALAVSRVRTLIQAVALQGVILGLLPIVMHGLGIHEICAEHRYGANQRHRDSQPAIPCAA